MSADYSLKNRCSERTGGGISETVGSLCARDYKGVGNQYVQDGKVIVQGNRKSSER